MPRLNSGPWRASARRLARRARRSSLRPAVVAAGAVCLVAGLALLWLRRTAVFDDVADIALVAAEERAVVERRANETSSHFADPLRLANVSTVREARVAWDYIFGELIRKPVMPVLTKYKKRLLKELYAKTFYSRVNKLSSGRDVSCNYVNNVHLQDALGLTDFECADTSHRCPDGRFDVTPAFMPIEGSWVTWRDVVLVLMVGAGREEFVNAAAETWMARLHPDATIYIARDNGLPSLPQSLLDRDNVVVWEYMGPVGFDKLDLKAFLVWQHAYQKFVSHGKKYFLKIDDDSFLVGHNLIRFLIKVDRWFSGREEALYFGHPFCGHGDLEALGYATYCYAGGGAYGLSIEAIQILIQQIKGGCAYFYDYVAKSPTWRPVDDKYGGRYEDVMVGRCLRQAKTRHKQNGTSLLACGSFFPYAPLHYYDQFGRSPERMYNKLGNNIITLHNLEPSAIRYLDHFIFEYPIGGGIEPFSPENSRLSELLEVCHLRGKKMYCDWPSPALQLQADTTEVLPAAEPEVGEIAAGADGALVLPQSVR